MYREVIQAAAPNLSRRRGRSVRDAVVRPELNENVHKDSMQQLELLTTRCNLPKVAKQLEALTTPMHL